MLKTPELFSNGFNLTHFTLSDDIQECVKTSDWAALDKKILQLVQKNGALYSFLRNYHDFESIEFIISIRDSENEWEEDGIWHDDGSRVFAFSLSLTLEKIDGGELGVRPKGAEHFTKVQTPSFGGIILFLTGVYGYEHKIHKVKKGRRIIIAGWCS